MSGCGLNRSKQSGPGARQEVSGSLCVSCGSYLWSFIFFVSLLLLLSPNGVLAIGLFGEHDTNAIGWGFNTFGQLGRGYESFSATPSFVTTPQQQSSRDAPTLGPLTFSYVYAAKDSVIAIEASTQIVYTWGSNYGSQIGVGSYQDDLGIDRYLHRSYPTALRYACSSEEFVTAKLVAARDNGILMVHQNNSVYISSSSSFSQSPASSYVQPFPSSTTAPPETIEGITCAGDYCAIWNSSVIYCYSMDTSPITFSACHTSLPMTNIKSVSLGRLHDWTQSPEYMLVSNSSDVWGTGTISYSQLVVEVFGCNPLTTWCKGKPIWSSTTQIVDEIRACGNFSLILAGSDVWYYSGFQVYPFYIPPPLPSTGHLKFQIPFLNPTSISCSQDIIFVTNKTAEDSSSVLSWQIGSNYRPSHPMLGRSIDLGFSSDPNNLVISLIKDPLPNGTLAHLNPSSKSVFVFIPPSTPRSSQQLSLPDTIQLVSWGLNDVGQAFTGSTLNSISVTASSLPYQSKYLTNSSCILYGAIDTSTIWCNGSHAYHATLSIVSPKDLATPADVWHIISRGEKSEEKFAERHEIE